MSQTNEQEQKPESGNVATAGDQPGLQSHRAGPGKKLVIALLAVVVIAGAALVIFLLRSRGDSGRPVPAPRSFTSDQSATQSTSVASSNEPTLTLVPEQLQRAGIKIETVGERMTGEMGGKQ